MLATISTKVNSEDKKQFENLCENLGLNVSVAINIYIKNAIKKKMIPIELKEIEERKPIDMSKYKNRGKNHFSTINEVDDYLKGLREDILNKIDVNKNKNV